MSSTGLVDPSATGQEGDEAAETSPQIQAPKKSRTNTPWTPSEEQRLKVMRDQGNSWGEIAKVGESSCVPQEWVTDALQRRSPIGLKEALKSIGTRYLSSFIAVQRKANCMKDMHYADFAEDDVGPRIQLNPALSLTCDE